MATRLDRLVLLLDSGSTPAVRSTAAQQLGDIQRQHPDELYNLLARVLVHLRSKSWETRVAAGEAIGAIAKNVHIWDPPPPPPHSTGSMVEEPMESDLTFDTFEIAKVMRCGVPLLSSAGKEFDDASDYANMDPRERIAFQKKQLKQRLGMEYMDLDFLSEADVKTDLKKSTSKTEQFIPPQLLEKGTKIKDDEDMSGLSARERNARKRKLKLEAKNKQVKETVQVGDLSSSSSMKKRKSMTDAAAQDASVKKIKEEDGNGTLVVEHKVKEELSISLGVFSSGDEWPFEGLCEQLCLDLFDYSWEIRHGAAIGLREVLKIHGAGPGRIVGLPMERNNSRHQQWLEDVSIRLLCVLALDRFADFVGDHVMVPVRETCAQTLGVILQFCNSDLCLRVVSQGLIKLVEGREVLKKAATDAARSGDGRDVGWEVRHAGLIGLKYWMAVKRELVKDVLIEKGSASTGTSVFNAILNGLKDRDDDVRAVSSSTLLPINDILVSIFPPEVIYVKVVSALWDCLLELDDLTAATASVMDLLSELISKTKIISLVRRDHMSLEKKVPRLYPFLRHAITSVRIAVLKSLRILLDIAESDTSGSSAKWLTKELMQLVFQNFVLEEKEDVSNLSLEIWTKIVKVMHGLAANQFCSTMSKHHGTFFNLLMTPIGTPIDPKFLYTPSFSGDSSTSNVSVHDKAMAQQDLTVVSEDVVMRGRILGATALGRCLSYVARAQNPAALHAVQSTLEGYLNSGFAYHRAFAHIIIEELTKCFLEMEQTRISVSEGDFGHALWNILVNTLNAADSGSALLFSELIPYLARLRNDCQAFLNVLNECGVPDLPILPPLPGTSAITADTSNPLGQFFILPVAEQLARHQFPNIITSVPPRQVKSTNKQVIDLHTALHERLRRIETGIEQFNTEQLRWDVVAYATGASAVVHLGKIPPKLNPVIRPLTNSIKFEASALLQERSAAGVAALLEVNIEREASPNINDKILNNLIVFLCADADWGSLDSVLDEEGILSLKLSEQGQLSEKDADKKGKPGKKKSELNQMAISAVDSAHLAVSDALKAQRAHEIVRRGAAAAIQSICIKFGLVVFEKMPRLWVLSTSYLTFFDAPTGEVVPGIVKCHTDPVFGQGLIDGLMTLSTVATAISPDLYPQLCSLLKPLCMILRAPLSLIRHAASYTLSRIVQVCTVQTMQALIELVVPLLGDTLSTSNRQGAAECISMLANSLEDFRLLPYIVFLIVPVLRRMSDPDESVRFVSTSVFAHLVKLVPLEAGVPDPEGLDPALLRMKEEERKFMGQLVGSQKVESFEIPKGIKAELRPYQKEGVSWLAFLNRYGLHGILCDDMGLGKTLQSICMLASDHHLRAEEFQRTKAPHAAHLPSLVVCPPTLTGHWKQEILQYAGEVLRPIIYSGGPSERSKQRSQFLKNDVVITSYDILRNDIDEMSQFSWNYCILDEGHIIKNGKTKLTKAVKTVKCMKRIILSGTPIQNNVLELWSLFDFLMPGFLGTEQQFQAKFGKPIIASRDAKSSSREQERGALALEALHKQVLPFLLRRMKEDVLDDLPPKIIQDYYVELSDVQRALYEDFGSSQGGMIAKDDVNALTAPDKGGKAKGTHVFQALQYLRKLCNHPSLVLKPEHPQYNQVCKKLGLDESSINDIKHAPKIAALRQLLLDCGIGAEASDTAGATTAQHRALIFVQMKEMLNHIENNLFKAVMPTVTYMRMDGSTDANMRHDMVRKFNADPSIDVFLLTTSVGGLGLNLTGADTVIFVEHDWNPMKDLQAMDRAHRIGQKRVVHVYRLITKGTLEEKIMGLQKFKLNIASTIINQENSGLESMDTDQILDLFALGDEKKGKEVGATENDGSAKKATMKEVLENLDGLWDEKQYESLDIGGFLEKLK
ncbi:btaf1 RNA polymerase II, B-TFIID transcription factor-associated, 170kDa [Phlyctochytrium planicorne]|nr:btaf1 RNA polymerase II, B-TFIID transcription factor-associated, 170kDa [Phlyctochytrium planicorne]